MKLTKAQIFAAKDAREIREIQVPEWGGFVHMREMNAAERDKFEADHEKSQHVNVRARLLCACLCDENGELMFREAEDVARLALKSINPIERLWKIAIKMNALTAKDMDDIEKK